MKWRRIHWLIWHCRCHFWIKQKKKKLCQSLFLFCCIFKTWERCRWMTQADDVYFLFNFHRSSTIHQKRTAQHGIHSLQTDIIQSDTDCDQDLYFPSGLKHFVPQNKATLYDVWEVVLRSDAVLNCKLKSCRSAGFHVDFKTNWQTNEGIIGGSAHAGRRLLHHWID